MMEPRVVTEANDLLIVELDDRHEFDGSGLLAIVPTNTQCNVQGCIPVDTGCNIFFCLPNPNQG